MTFSLQLPFSLIKFSTIDNQRNGVLNRYSRRGHMKRVIKDTLLEIYITYLISCSPRKASEKT